MKIYWARKFIVYIMKMNHCAREGLGGFQFLVSRFTAGKTTVFWFYRDFLLKKRKIIKKSLYNMLLMFFHRIIRGQYKSTILILL